MESAKKEHEKQVALLQRQGQEHVEKLKSSWAQKEEPLKQVHEEQTFYLRRQKQELGDALMVRDEKIYQATIFTSSDSQKTDRQLREAFMSLRKLVGELGSVPWKLDQRLWKEETLSRSGEKYGQRMLKKAVLEDIIWTSLFHHVFASPFRVFGSEGQKMERE